MYYKDVKECTYRINIKKFVIYGNVEATHYKYEKNGRVDTNPCYHKNVDGIIKFYTVFSPNIDFIAEIEKYSPLKVVIDNE